MFTDIPTLNSNTSFKSYHGPKHKVLSQAQRNYLYEIGSNTLGRGVQMPKQRLGASIIDAREADAWSRRQIVDKNAHFSYSTNRQPLTPIFNEIGCDIQLLNKAPLSIALKDSRDDTTITFSKIKEFEHTLKQKIETLGSEDSIEFNIQANKCRLKLKPNEHGQYQLNDHYKRSAKAWFFSPATEQAFGNRYVKEVVRGGSLLVNIAKNPTFGVLLSSMTRGGNEFPPFLFKSNADEILTAIEDWLKSLDNHDTHQALELAVGKLDDLTPKGEQPSKKNYTLKLIGVAAAFGAGCLYANLNK